MKLNKTLTLRTIGEVSEHLKIPAHVLRFWESKFSFLKPLKINGRRYYSNEDYDKLSLICEMIKKQNLSISQIQKIFTAKNNHQDLILQQTRKKLVSAKKKLFALLKNDNYYNNINQLDFNFQ